MTKWHKSLFVGLLTVIAAVFGLIGCGGVIDMPDIGETGGGNNLAAVDTSTIYASLQNGTLTIDWGAVDHAERYVVTFGEEQYTCNAPAASAVFYDVEYTSGTLTVTIVAQATGYKGSSTTHTFIPSDKPNPNPNPQPDPDPNPNPNPQPTTLATPSGLTVNNGTLRWSPVANATSYVVSDGNKSATVTTNSIKLASQGLTVPTSGSIVYTVVAKASGYTNSAAASLTYTYTPQQPTTLAIPAALFVAGGELRWNAVENATSYVVSDGTTTKTVNTNKIDLAANGFNIADGKTATYSVIAKAAGYNDSPAASKTHTFAHVHTFAQQWTRDETHHWHVADCGHSIIAEDSRGWGVHNFGNGNTCSVCGFVRQMQELGKYAYYGTYPQTLKAANVTVSGSADSNGYYTGSDGAKYAKVIATPYFMYQGAGVKFSNNENVVTGNTYYFKVEPIKWRVLETKGGVAFLLCDTILDHGAYYGSQNSREIGGETVYPNNYANSDIRTWLNGTFYAKAFSSTQQKSIQTTTVDNSAMTTGRSVNTYACVDTQDKIFLPSYKEVHNSAYGFISAGGESDETRMLIVSDYARATGAFMSDTYAWLGRGMWWTRSPIWDSSTNISQPSPSGTVAGSEITSEYVGVAPAMHVTASALA